jgi:hypothetical protein
LSTEDYRALVFSSDIILLPYDRDNYYARSSGILVESLVAGIPVIVPAGTWMAEQFMEETFRYHASLNVAAKILENTEIQWYRRVDSELCPVLTGELSFGGEETRLFCHISPPQQSTHILLSFKVDESREGDFVFLNTDQLADRGYSLSRKAFIVRETASGNPCSVLFPLEKEVSQVILDFKNAFANSEVSIIDVQIRFISANDLNQYPLGVVGLTYAHPEQIPDLIREMIANYSHYRQTAYSFSWEWFNKHNAERLVAKLERAVECATSDRAIVCSNAAAPTP